MRVARIIVIAGVLSFSLIGGKVRGQDLLSGSVGHSPSLSGTSFRDSVYRRIIREGGKSIDCHLSYRIGSSEVLPSYKGNPEELGRLDDFLRATLSDTLVQIKDISLTGYGSIDGTYLRNEELSRARSEGFALYLRRRYPLLSSYAVRTSHVAEDWAGLAELVSSSSLEEKERILSIINKVGVFDGREKQLMELSGGNPYREMERIFFPQLRRVQVKVEYDLQKVIEEHYQVKIPQKDFAAVLESERRRLGIPVSCTDTLHGANNILESLVEELLAQEELLRKEEQLRQDQENECKEESALPPSSLRPLRAGFVPLFSVKTNLVSLAGYSSELQKRYLTPNVELEYFLAPHWSVSGEWVYGVTDVGGNEAHVWAPSTLSLEPRYWFSDSSGGHKRFYLGIYGLGGQYDYLSSEAQDKGRTGSYYEGGLSLGYYLPLSSRLGLELGARLGYRSISGTRYSYSDLHYYYQSFYTESGLKATGFRVSVSYRFGRTYSPRK